MVIVLLGVVSVLAPGELSELEGVLNPFGLEGATWLVDAEVVLLLLFVTCILASAVSLILRYRALVYGSLTATLAVVYVGGVVSLQSVFRGLTGQEPPLPSWPPLW